MRVSPPSGEVHRETRRRTRIDRLSGAPKAALTSHDIAELAGVSQTTVSRVLRGDPRVRPVTRARVLKALADTRFEPNAAARAFRTNRSGAIGVVVARLSYQLFPAILEMISAQLARLGLRMIVWDAEHGGDLPASRALRQGIVDGVILTAATEASEFLHDIEADAPVVLVNRTVDRLRLDQVSSANLDGGRQVGRYLVASGRKRIALISGASQASTIREREQGFRESLAGQERPLAPQYNERVESFSHAGHVRGREAAIRLMELAEPPDAIFCVNDVLALGAMDGARSLGVRIPEDLWVVGYDDIELASWDAYDLTTVRQPMAQMIEQAITMLLARIAQRDRPTESICFPNGMVIRRSTARQPWQAAADQLPP